MNLSLTNHPILITGAAKGIGQGIAIAVAEEGGIPVIIGRNEEDNLATLNFIKKNGGKGMQVVAELVDPSSCQKVVEKVLAEYGSIHGLVNNAGVNDSVGLEDGNYQSFVDSLHRNLIHYYMMAQAALPSLKLSGGSIVNISSKTADTGQGGTSGYAASNGGRNALTREWAVELLPYNIRVNAVIVAESYTPLYEKWIKSLPNPEAKKREIEGLIPLGNRMTSTEEIANMVLFLLSDRSSHTTGQLIYVDGGYVHLDRAIRGDR